MEQHKSNSVLSDLSQQIDRMKSKVTNYQQEGKRLEKEAEKCQMDNKEL